MSWAAALLTSLGHEFVLTTSWYQWVLGDTPRNDWINENREGIVSSPGYCAILLAGVSLGQLAQEVGPTVKDHIITFSRLGETSYK